MNFKNIMDEKPTQFVFYQTEDKQTRLIIKTDGETVWLSQKQMADLFQKDVRTVNEHIQNIFEERELSQESVIRNFRITAQDGKTYDTQHYNLDVIISVGYRVKSHRGTQFRIWATQRLREYLVKGFAMDDERLKEGKTSYFDELLSRMVAKTTQAPAGRQKTNRHKSLSPHPGLDSICSFTHGFTVGYFLPSLRDSRRHPHFAAARPWPVSKKDFRLESTRGQPPFTRPGIVERAVNWSCVTVRQTVSLTMAIS